jgi:hypothetical protein
MADKELSPLQKKFREYFQAMLDKFGVESPAELDEDERVDFFNAVAMFWEKGKGPKKDPKDLPLDIICPSCDTSKKESKEGDIMNVDKFVEEILGKIKKEEVNESPVGAPGRTSRAEALEFIAKNPEKIRELKKIIKQAGGKTVFMELIKIILDPNFDEKNLQVKVDDVELMRLKKIEQVLQGKFI